MRHYFAYVRVSTQKQGEHGSSLQEQRAAIEAFAARERLPISEWFEERVTAAKQGRAVFRRMFALLDKGKAHGVVMHKIDRGARNLSDWADLAKLLDKGIEVRFANDNLDMTSRGGRLAADIQAVVAADYIRNLREEVLKGIYGRLKQGFYPRAAPPGYLDNGPARPKTICPTVGPHIRRAFELYATGNYSLRSLADELTRNGARTPQGRLFTYKRLSTILANPFYYGLMRIKSSNQAFIGNHEPLIPKALFDRVRSLNRTQIKVKTGIRHAYVLQRMIRCAKCSRSLYAEKHKGRVYYRCQTRACAGGVLREDRVLQTVTQAFDAARIDDHLLDTMDKTLSEVLATNGEGQARTRDAINLQLVQLRERENRLTDAYLERAIDKDTLDERRSALNDERVGLLQALADVANPAVLKARGTTFLELLKALKNVDTLENADHIREICRYSISNFIAHGKNVGIAWRFPINLMFCEHTVRAGAPARDESTGSTNVQNGGPVHGPDVWTEKRIRCLLETVIRGKPLGEQTISNNIPTSPHSSKAVEAVGEPA